MSTIPNAAEIEIRELTEAIEEFSKRWRNSSGRYLTHYPANILPRNANHCLDINAFHAISLRASSILPKTSDTSLSSIDDLLMSDIIQPVETFPTRAYSQESMSKFLQIIIDLFHHVIMTDRILDPVSTSVLVQSIDIVAQKEAPLGYLMEFMCLPYLIQPWKITDVCLVLKIMKAALRRHFVVTNQLAIRHDKNTTYFIDSIEWLMKWKNIPQAKSLKNRRITSWISHQVETILEFVVHSFHCDFTYTFSTNKNDQESYIEKFLGATGPPPPPKELDYLYSYFFSTNDQHQRIQLIESFIWGLKAYDDKRYKTSFSSLESYPPEEISFLSTFKDFVFIFNSYFYDILQNKTYPEEKWKELEKYNCNSFEPYLAEDVNSSTGIQHSSGQKMSEKFKDTLSLASNEPPEDLVIQNYVLFDDFINRLQVISILHAVFWKTADVLMIDQFAEKHESKVFRSIGVIKTFFNRILTRKAFRCKFSMWIQVAVKLCPFLFLSKHHEYLMGDLLKMLKGEQLNEETLAELYFAVNHCPYDISRETDMFLWSSANIY